MTFKVCYANTTTVNRSSDDMNNPEALMPVVRGDFISRGTIVDKKVHDMFSQGGHEIGLEEKQLGE